MIRHFMTLVVLCGQFCAVQAQDAKMVETVKGLTRKMIEATVEGNYRVVLDMTHPKVLEMMGGKEVALAEVEKIMKTIKQQGFKFQLKDIGTPTLAKGGNNLYSVTPSSMVMTGQGKKITVKSAIIGQSTDGGANWKFINMDDKGEKGVRMILPELPKEMVIPKQEQKVEDE